MIKELSSLKAVGGISWKMQYYCIYVRNQDAPQSQQTLGKWELFRSRPPRGNSVTGPWDLYLEGPGEFCSADVTSSLCQTSSGFYGAIGPHM